MVHKAPARPFRSLDRTRLLDGTVLGVPEAARGNPLLEETGFERLVTFDANGATTELSSPNATQQGADEASAEATREAEPGALRLPRIIANALATLAENDRARNPEAGDSPFFDAQRAQNVAAGEDRLVLDIAVDAGDELHVTSIGTDAVDAQDQVEVSIDGDVVYRKLFSPMTLSEARGARCFDPPHVARKTVKVKVKNNGGAARDIQALLRGWSRPLMGGTLGQVPDS